MAGMKISDKGGWPGTSDGLMKSKTHLKGFSSAEGAGAEMDYEDTTEKIKAQQSMGSAKAKSHQMKPGHRN